MLKKATMLCCAILVVNVCAATTTAKKKSKKPPNIQVQKPIIPSQNIIENVTKKGVITDFGDSNLEALAQKIRVRKNLKIHFFGDSHIAGDYIPQEWRTLFFQPNSVGFAYPLFPKYHQNLLIAQKSQFFEIYNSRITSYSNYPMGGIIARAKNERAYVRISLNFTQDNQRFLTQITFKSPSLLGAFTITDSAGKTYRLAAKSPNQWEISDPMNLRYPIIIKALLPNAMLGGYFIYNPNTNNFISHSATNGARSDIYLKWNQGLLKKQLEVLKYDLIVLCYGSNDAMSQQFSEETFMKNYQAFISLLRKTSPNATILIMSPPKVVTKRKNTNSYSLAPNAESVKKAVLKLAKSEKTLYFDMFELMEKTGGKDKWIKVGLSKQDVHLTSYGYRTVADAMYSGLKQLISTIPQPAIQNTAKPTSQGTDTLEITTTPIKQEAKNNQSTPQLKDGDPVIQNEPPTPPSTTQNSPYQNLNIPTLKEPSNDVPEEIWQDLQIIDLDDENPLNNAPLNKNNDDINSQRP